MPTYEVTYQTTINLTVTISAPEEDIAEEQSWRLAEDYLDTVMGDHRNVRADATLDGIGHDTIKEIEP